MIRITFQSTTFIEEGCYRLDSPGFDVGDTHAVNPGGTLVSGHVDPGSPHHIAADEFVEVIPISE
jgi:hypothetical protein